MKSLTRGNFRAARKTIQAHRARSYMTMLGIVIGIASVATVMSIGEGVKRQVSQQVSHAGETVITVRPGAEQDARSRFGLSNSLASSSSLTVKDVSAISATSGVTRSSPLAVVPGKLTADGQTYTAGPVVATGDDLPALLNQSVAYGAFFTVENDDEEVAVLGEHAALKLFGQEVPLGQSFTFRGHSFIVAGILTEFAAAPLTSDVSFNDSVFIPYTTAEQLEGSSLNPYEVLVKARDKQAVPGVVKALDRQLSNNHGGAHDFAVLKASDSLAQTKDVLALLTKLIAGAAAISLFVAGIGIMNITLVSVTERLHEIGIRKAVGATNRQILNEFLAEAVVLSAGGGIVGIVLSLIITLLLRIFTDIAPVVQCQVLVGATLISMLIGVIFGTIPALKAARKDPIAALRGE